jgi:phospholipid/cholesterol/gamma-HCH transport system ATP-binding protein
MQDTQHVQKPVKKIEDTTVVDIQQLKKSFGENQVLKEITLTLKKGENLVVLGKSGTGKSILIKCLVGLIDIDEGKVNVLGNNIPELKQQELNELRKKIGFLFQSGALYDSMTVRENLEFPVRRQLNSRSKENIQKLVIEALEDVGLADAIDKMPAELSGGMRKRISLARTLILKPEIMLYDEPTTGLDTITSKEISHLILKIQKKFKTSSIIITHDMECARIVADRVIILNDGKVIGEGTYDELKNSSDNEINAFFV